MRFVGKGEAATLIENYARLNGIKNIQFDGYYEKKDEHYFIKKASLLNIFYPKIVSHSTALSNRFYNALVYKKPMIVTAKSTQGDYVEKYDLGLSLEDCSELSEKIQRFFKNTDEEAFNQRCNNLLREFIRDYDEFYKVVKNFIEIIIMSIFKDKTLLITGGTGSFGNAVLRRFLDSDIKEIRIFSRDEKKQDDMRLLSSSASGSS